MPLWFTKVGARWGPNSGFHFIFWRTSSCHCVMCPFPSTLFLLFFFSEPPRPSARLLPTPTLIHIRWISIPLFLHNFAQVSVSKTPHLIPSCWTVFSKVPYSSLHQEFLQGASLVVQWLRLQAPSAGVLASIPGCRTGSHMLQLRVQGPQLRPGAAK